MGWWGLRCCKRFEKQHALPTQYIGATGARQLLSLTTPARCLCYRCPPEGDHRGSGVGSLLNQLVRAGAPEERPSAAEFQRGGGWRPRGGRWHRQGLFGMGVPKAVHGRAQGSAWACQRQMPGHRSCVLGQRVEQGRVGLLLCAAWSYCSAARGHCFAVKTVAKCSWSSMEGYAQQLLNCLPACCLGYPCTARRLYWVVVIDTTGCLARIPVFSLLTTAA